MDPKQNLGENPAATIADAAMSGATPVVATTDLNASDVTPEPTMSAPTLDENPLGAPVLDTAALEAAAAAEAPVAPVAPAAPAPETNGPVSLSPSADFQMDAVSTVSAVQNGADGNLAAQNEDIMVGQPLPAAPTAPTAPALDQIPAPEENPMNDNNFNQSEQPSEGEPVTAEKMKEEYEYDPLVPAAPAPGSIGSAKSYADIQRAEAEKAARRANNGGKVTLKDPKILIMVIIIAVIAVIGIVIGVIAMSSGSSAPVNTPAPISYPDPEDEISTLSCTRNLVSEEYVSYGAASGVQENVFYFRNEVLDGLETNFIYTYETLDDVTSWRDRLSADFGVVPNSRNLIKEIEPVNAVENEEEDEEDTESESELGDETEGESEITGEIAEKTAADMLYHYVNSDVEEYTVTHGMEIKSEDIDAWVASDAYSDVTYGASRNDETATRDIKYFNQLQNNIGYTCITVQPK